MREKRNKTNAAGKGEKSVSWILIFYTVPSKPVKNRIKFWRRLAKAGAVQLKGAVYVLPHNEEHYEFCQWLMAEVAALGGEGDFVIADSFEMLSNSEIIALFKNQRGADYGTLAKKLDELEMKLSSIEKGSGIKNADSLWAELEKLAKEYTEIKGIDFFPFKASHETEKKFSTLQRKMTEVLKQSAAKETGKDRSSIPRRNPDSYRGKVWTTRKNPFVDRMASAWFIRNFIDKEAVFQFTDGHDTKGADNGTVFFDMKNGEFTHIGDQCTFEVLMKSFSVKDRAVRKIAEIVHELDMKDDRFSSPEAKGIEAVLAGIRKTATDDSEALERGITVFELLYSSKTS